MMRKSSKSKSVSYSTSRSTSRSASRSGSGSLKITKEGLQGALRALGIEYKRNDTKNSLITILQKELSKSKIKRKPNRKSVRTPPVMEFLKDPIFDQNLISLIQSNLTLWERFSRNPEYHKHCKKYLNKIFNELNECVEESHKIMCLNKDYYKKLDVFIKIPFSKFSSAYNNYEKPDNIDDFPSADKLLELFIEHDLCIPDIVEDYYGWKSVDWLVIYLDECFSEIFRMFIKFVTKTKQKKLPDNAVDLITKYLTD
jgi:hypothetical protein